MPLPRRGARRPVPRAQAGDSWSHSHQRHAAETGYGLSELARGCRRHSQIHRQPHCALIEEADGTTVATAMLGRQGISCWNAEQIFLFTAQADCIDAYHSHARLSLISAVNRQRSTVRDSGFGVYPSSRQRRGAKR